MKISMSEYGGGRIRICKVPVAVQHKGSVTGDLLALVDSGASVNLASFNAGLDVGFTREELLSGDEMFIDGVGGGSTSYGHEVYLIVGDEGPDPQIHLHARVYFLDTKLPFGVHVILGQRNALEQMVFSQMNQQPEPAFELAYPQSAA